MILDKEDVARAIFSPRMVYRGQILPAAFELRPQLAEDYVSVMRMIFESWKKDVLSIPQRKNRQLYGYAEMNVGEIRDIQKDSVIYDVIPTDNATVKSHAGIVISVNGERIVGGRQISTINNKNAQDFLLLSIRQELVRLAQKRLKVLNHNV